VHLRVDDSEPCQLLHSGRGYWIFRSWWIVFIHVIEGRPGGLLQFSKGEAVKIFLASVSSGLQLDNGWLVCWIWYQFGLSVCVVVRVEYSICFLLVSFCILVLVWTVVNSHVIIVVKAVTCGVQCYWITCRSVMTTAMHCDAWFVCWWQGRTGVMICAYLLHYDVWFVCWWQGRTGVMICAYLLHYDVWFVCWWQGRTGVMICVYLLHYDVWFVCWWQGRTGVMICVYLLHYDVWFVYWWQGRTGVMICSYLLHCRYCNDADEVLDFYGRARTFNAKVGPIVT